MSPRPSLSRRRRPALALAAAVTALGLLTACSSAVGDGGSGGSGEPQSGGVLKVGTVTDLVPAAIFTNSNDTINLVIGQVFDSLVDYPIDSLEAEPSLAESWELAEDGTSITLQLRDDVTFHSGRPFASEDVEFSIRQWADPKWTVQFQRTAAAITEFDTSEEHSITLGFDHPMNNVLDLLDILPIIDSETIDQLEKGEAYVGTGPFTFESWTPQSKLVLDRNDDYWGDTPRLDGVEIDIVPDAQSLVSQLRSGQLDLAQGASNRDIESLAGTGDFDQITFEGSERQTYVGTNVENPALSDPDVRRAIALSVDRDRVVEEVYRGVGYPIALPWPEYSPAYDPEANESLQQDLDEARSLLEGKDLPPLPLEYSTANPNNEAIAQIVQADLKQVGLDVELVPNEQAQQIEKLIGGSFEALWILDHAYAQYTPSSLAVSAYPFNAAKNTSNFLDDQYAAHADAAWKQPDPAGPEAEAAYADLNADLLDNLFLIELSTTFMQAVSKADLEGVSWTKRSELTFGETWLDR